MDIYVYPLNQLHLRLVKSGFILHNIAYNCIILYKENMDNFYNVNQSAFIMKVHPLTVRRYIREGKLKAVKLGGNVRIKERDLQSFMRDFEPREQQEQSVFRKVSQQKEFTTADPFLRLKGRAATVEI